MQCFKKFLCTSLVLFVFIGVWAQNASVRSFTSEDGLPSSEVFHILQDRHGFLWFSTGNGIARFDGENMKAFQVSDGVPDPLVLEMREDKAGKIWLRTYSGNIGYYADGKVHPYIFNDTLSKFISKSYLENFAEVDSGKWIFYESINRYITLGEKGTIHDIGKIPLDVVQIDEYGDQLIIGSHVHSASRPPSKAMLNGKLYPITITHSVRDPKAHHPHHNAIRWKNNLYFSFNNNVFKFNGQSVERILITPAPIINLSTDKQDNFYVGLLNEGVMRYRDEDLKQGEKLSFTEHLSVTQVLEDREGGLWISTLEGGVLYLPTPHIKHHTVISPSKIRSAIAYNGKLYFGQYDGTFSVLDERSLTVEYSHTFDRTIFSIFGYHDTLFVATNDLYVYADLKKKPVYKYLGVIRDLYPHRNKIWTAETSFISEFRGDGKRIYREQLYNSLRNIVVTDSLIYTCLHIGFEVRDHNLNVVQTPELFSDLKISDFHILNDSTYIFGTTGNGLIISDKNLKTYMRFDRVAKNISSMVQIGEYYYFGTERGVLRTRVTDLMNRSVRAEMLTAQNGLLRDEINLLAKTADDNLLVVYDNAFSIVDLHANSFPISKPVFYIEKISINNYEVPIRSNFNLPYDSNTLQIDYGFLSFNNQSIDVRYRLNKNDTWIYPPNIRSIPLYALAPGEYALEFEYSIDHLNWQKAEGIPVFNIHKPWWQKLWVQGIILTVIVIVVFIIARNRWEIQRERANRLKLINDQQQLMMKTETQTMDRERNRIAKDLHDSVGSNLLAAKMSIGRILKQHNHGESEAIEQQLGDIVREIKGIIYDLSPPELERYGLSIGLKNYIDKLSGVTDIELEASYYGKELTDARTTVPVFRILQELLSNSIKHSGGKKITLQLNAFEALLNIVYEDSGTGFELEKVERNGFGLANIRSRVASLGGKLSFESGSFGTSYTIDIPLKPQTDA